MLVLPNVAGFVGSDLVAVLLSCLSEDDGGTRLAVDIGTNGEMALMHKGRMLVCSAAAGPAFEGAGISSGMRGSPGAIDSVKIGDTVEVTTIEHHGPYGIAARGLWTQLPRCWMRASWTRRQDALAEEEAGPSSAGGPLGSCARKAARSSCSLPGKRPALASP